jgi:hypothetical protein
MELPESLMKSGGVNYLLLPKHLHHIAMFPDDPQVMPQEFLIIAAFSETGELLGRTMFVSLPHIEGTRVRDDMQGSRIAYNLVKLMEKEIQRAGRTHAWAFVQEGDKDISNYMDRLGYEKLPLEVWVKDMREGAVKGNIVKGMLDYQEKEREVKNAISSSNTSHHRRRNRRSKRS